MKILVRCLLIFLSAGQIVGQNLDSLYNSLIELNALSEKSSMEIQSQPPVKCGFSVVADVKLNFDKFTPEQQYTISKILDRPELPLSIVSPKGLFRLHYTQTGPDAVAYDVNEAAAAFDSAYTYEVNILGYPSPSSDNGAGGDNLYDVYIKNLGPVYGITTPETHIGSDRYTSYIRIDNDFDPNNFYSSGIDGVKVTAAHEFHHAIQVSAYINRSSDRFYYEITSTSMEDFVYDTIDDYVAYMPAYFRNTDVSFSKSQGNGYDLAVWNLFLDQRFKEDGENIGKNIIKRSWEMMPQNHAVRALSSAIEEAGYSIRQEFNNFAIWNYFTNYRKKDGEYYKDAASYPPVVPMMSTNYNPPEQSYVINSYPVSNTYLRFLDDSEGFSDTLVVILTDADIADAIDNPNSENTFNYLLSSEYVEGSKKIIDNKYYSAISGEGAQYIGEADIFNNEVAGTLQLDRGEIDYAFPQPFNYKKHSILKIPAAKSLSDQAELNIYTTAMDLVYTGKLKINTLEKVVVYWDGKDNNGNQLPTGIYIYATNSGDEIKKGKILILNE